VATSRRDPYDVMGVAPGATAAEITTAYRDLARRHHPDQHPDDSVEQRRRREAKMAEINVAHAALLEGWTRPPSRPPAPAHRQHQRPRVPPPPPPRRQASPEQAEPTTDEPVSPWRVLTVLGVGVAVLVAVVAIVVAVVSPASEPTPTEDQPVVVDVQSWTVGTCVSDGAQAEAVRCEFPNRGMVVADVFTIDQCPAGTDAFVADPPRLLCVDFDP
jgi:hypothetical protein